MRIVRIAGTLTVMAALWLAIGVSSVSAAAVVKTITVGAGPVAVSSDGTHVWVTNAGDTVSEIDASTGKVVKTIPVGSSPAYGVSSDGTHVWVADTGGDTVSEIDASTGTVVRKIKVGRRPFGVSAHGTHVWVTNSYGDTVSEIDASTGKVVRKIKVGRRPFGVSSDGTHVWVANDRGGSVSEIKIGKRWVVPKLTGRTLAAANTALKQADCAVGKITKRKSSTVPKGRVISSSPKAGSEHRAGTKVALTVSRGKH